MPCPLGEFHLLEHLANPRRSQAASRRRCRSEASSQTPETVSAILSLADRPQQVFPFARVGSLIYWTKNLEPGAIEKQSGSRNRHVARFDCKTNPPVDRQRRLNEVAPTLRSPLVGSAGGQALDGFVHLRHQRNSGAAELCRKRPVHGQSLRAITCDFPQIRYDEGAECLGFNPRISIADIKPIVGSFGLAGRQNRQNLDQAVMIIDPSAKYGLQDGATLTHRH